MRRYFINTIALGIIVGIFFSSRPAIPKEFAKPAQVTPTKELVGLLNHRYPGFRLADRGDYCRNFEKEHLPYVGRDGRWAYGALKGDFNGDLLEDYALIIKAGGRYIWLAALKRRGSEPAYEMTEFGEPFIRSDRIPETKLKGKICDGLFVIGGPGRMNPFDYFGMENISSATQFYWKDGKWVETGCEP